MKNVPYKKVYGKNGELLNPIVGKYVNKFPNRRQRKEELKKKGNVL